MQLSKLTLLSLLSAAVNAAPVVETVTKVVMTTVIVQGENQSINTAPVFTESPSETAAATTAAVTSASADPDFVLQTTEEASTPTSTSVPTTLETSSTSLAATVQAKAVETTSSTAAETTSSTSSSAEAAATSAASDFQTEILNEHNAKRALHGVSDLTWDSTLEAYAQNYADDYDCSGTLTHSGGQYGENLAIGYTTTGAVDAWYSEGDDYTYGSGCSVYDHFTQVVWKSTTKVGCGYKKCGSYWGTYIICSYDPAGNYVGECDSNVTPLV